MDPTLKALGCNRGFLFLVRQFFEEHNLHKTLHMFEQETGFFFDMKYFEGLVLSSNWNDAENYLSSFTVIEDNENSYKIYFEIRKQKYLEALQIGDFWRAMEILTTDLNVFVSSNEDLHRELNLLLTMDDFRTHSSISMFGDMVDVRKNMMNQIKLLIRENPKFQNKLEFPQIEKSRLLRLVNQSYETYCIERQQVHRSYPQPGPQLSRTMPVEAGASVSVKTRLNQPSVPNPHISTSTANFVNISNHGSSSRGGCITPLDNNLAINASAAPKTTTQNVRVPGWMEGSERSKRRLISLNASSFRFLRLPSGVNTTKICRLVYTSTGNEIVGLAASGNHLVWRWSGTKAKNYGWATTNCGPQLYGTCSESGAMIVNDSSQIDSPILALSNNNSYLISGSGNHAFLFSAITFKKLGSYLMPPPAATCVSYFPPDNNIVAVGMDDSTILIYNVRQSEIINRLQGHVKRISGLIFSTRNNVLVSAGLDTQIIVWDYTSYLIKQNTWLEISTECQLSEASETMVRFFKDDRHILVVHETQLAIYETTSLARVQKWIAEQTCRRISHATLSSDDLLIYAGFRNGTLLIFNAWDLVPAFNIDPSVYLPHNLSCRVYPRVVAENPQKPNQFAVGLSDGGVVVIEPHEITG